MDKDTRNGILRFLERAERLKDTCRFAYTSSGRTESAAAHTWRVCLLAVVLEEQYPQLDSGRLLKLCLVHDLGEALGEDVPAPEQDEGAEAGGKSENERRALLALVAPLPEALKEKIVALWEEYEAAETPEAQLAKGLDRLETLLQHIQGDNPPDFDYEFNLEYGREYTSGDPTLEGLRDEIDATTRQLADER